MSNQVYIAVQFQWEGLHCWPEAHGAEAYLKHQHRHMFMGLAKINVYNYDRELEFFEVKRYITNILLKGIPSPSDWSCERMANHVVLGLIEHYGNREIEVTICEDGENGSTIHHTPPKESR